jgi:hypothetical protein
MLGRRLLLLAAILMLTGAIAAALTPRDLREPAPPTQTRPVPTSPPAAAGGTPATRELSRTVNADARRPQTVRARVGDLLHLTVRAQSPDEVELVGLDRFEAADQFSPARFDFFVERAGSFPIRLREARREIGRLVVSAATGTSG